MLFICHVSGASANNGGLPRISRRDDAVNSALADARRLYQESNITKRRRSPPRDAAGSALVDFAESPGVTSLLIVVTRARVRPGSPLVDFAEFRTRLVTTHAARWWPITPRERVP